MQPTPRVKPRKGLCDPVPALGVRLERLDVVVVVEELGPLHRRSFPYPTTCLGRDAQLFKTIRAGNQFLRYLIRLIP
jgi:hypothetical protein